MTENTGQEAAASSEIPLVTPKVGKSVEPLYPILDVTEVWDGRTDLHSWLSAKEQAQLTDEEVAVHIRPGALELPAEPVTALQVMTKAAGAATPDEIGYRGPTVASVALKEGAVSRYQRQHGRDDLIAANDVYELYPKLLDTVVTSLASSQGMEHESFVPGQPYGFERPGSIILVNSPVDDPLSVKFLNRKDWKPRFYGSADAPGLFVNAIANLQAADSTYLSRRSYTAIDGKPYKIDHAFDLSVGWLTDRMDENREGLIEYSNPYTNGRGMRNQGWKDSADAMVHANGDWVNSQSGVAAIEIQCQAVISLRQAANIYRTVYDDPKRAGELEARAGYLQNFILDKAWIEDVRGGYFAMGWDRDTHGQLRRIDTRSIDMHAALQLLDMDDDDQRAMAFATVRTLTSEEMFTRWGSRVMSSREKAYRDWGYHRGVWINKSNEVAGSMSGIGLYAIDRRLGGHTTQLIKTVRCFPEYVSGEDSEEPVIPDKDIYVYDPIYHELLLAVQMPPIAQTWGASSELRKQHRYTYIPREARTAAGRAVEAQIIGDLYERYGALD